jgi:hypothetical protein
MPSDNSVDDKELLLLAVLFETASGVIDWTNVLRHLPANSLTAHDLQYRLNVLRESNSLLLSELPATFVQGSCLLQPVRNRTRVEIYEAVDHIFGHITQDEVRQPVGQPHLNVGEMAPVGEILPQTMFLLTLDQELEAS